VTDSDQNPRDVLRSLLEKHGPFLADEPDRCGSLLRRHLPQHAREVNVLIAAAQAGVPAALRASPDVEKLAQRITEQHGTREDLARWAVDTWAFALGLSVQPKAAAARATRAPLPESLATDRENVSHITDAIIAGDMNKLRAFIEEGISVRHRDRFGQLPLFVAARDGRAEAARLLVAQGLDVNAPVESGQKALYWAAHGGHLDVVRTLLDLGASVDAVALEGCASQLVTQRLNAPDRSRWSFEQSCGPNDHVKIAETLIRAGADVNVACGLGGTTVAQTIRDTEIVQLIDLLKGREKKRSFFSGLFGS
jgi:hypothetical protein